MNLALFDCQLQPVQRPRRPERLPQADNFNDTLHICDITLKYLLRLENQLHDKARPLDSHLLEAVSDRLTCHTQRPDCANVSKSAQTI